MAHREVRTAGVTHRPPIERGLAMRAARTFDAIVSARISSVPFLPERDACPVLWRFIQAFNDSLPDDERQRLLNYVDACASVATSKVLSSRRLARVRDFLCRQLTSIVDAAEARLSQHRASAGDATMASSLADGGHPRVRGNWAVSAEAEVFARRMASESCLVAAAAAMGVAFDELCSDPEAVAVGTEGWRCWAQLWMKFAQWGGEGGFLEVQEDVTAPLLDLAQSVRSEVWSLFERLLIISDT